MLAAFSVTTVGRPGQGTNQTAHHYPQSHLQAVMAIVTVLGCLAGVADDAGMSASCFWRLVLGVAGTGTSAAGVPGASGTGGNGRGTIAKG